MVFSSKTNKNNNNEGWGMGFLLVFFHHHHLDEHNHHNHRKKASFSLSSPSFLSLKPTNLLLSKTQSTLSICGLLLFTTLLLFTLSTFEPTTIALHHHSHRHNHHNYHHATPSRRLLLQQNYQTTHHGSFIRTLFAPQNEDNGSNFTPNFAPALHGMGALYRRGTKAMSDLMVGHVTEDVSEKELRSFLRVIHHSGLLSRSDLVLVFPFSPPMASEFGSVVKDESDSFLRLVHELDETPPDRVLGTGLTRYLRAVSNGEEKEALWGKRSRPGINITNWADSSELTQGQTQTSYGSVVSFDVSELDPENSLSGFLDHVPMSLRRWACYPMLLGRVRRNYKHVMLIDVKNSLVLSDPFARIRNRSSDSVFLWSNSDTELTRHRRKNSFKGHNNHRELKNLVNPGVIVGGSRGVRRFSNAALTEIVRVVIEHKAKSRNLVTESELVNQLVHSGHVLKGINLINPGESIPDAVALAGFNSHESGSSLLAFSDYYSVIQRGRSGGVSGSLDIDHVITREICSSHKLYSSVYRDCLSSQ